MQCGSSWKQMPLSIIQTAEKTCETNKENYNQIFSIEVYTRDQCNFKVQKYLT
jgi:hypothetical protein